MKNQKLTRVKVIALIAIFFLPYSSSLAQVKDQKALKRWVIGAGVNLRAEANINSSVLTRMALNTPVNLISTIPSSKYCEVELIPNGEAAQRGFTACEYLGKNVIKSREIANAYLEDGKTPNPNYNPERAFWLNPSYEALTEYGRYLERQRQSPKNDAQGVFLSEKPKIPEFERMKEHLAKGILVPKSTSFIRWDDMKVSARNLEIERLKLIKKSGPIEDLKFDELYGSSLHTRSQYLIDTTGVRTLDGDQGRSAGLTTPPKLPAFIESLELPIITNSYFQSHDEIAAPTTNTNRVAAKFQIIETIKTKNHESLPSAQQNRRSGLWDIFEVSRSLTQPVIKHTLLSAGGNIKSEATYLRQTYPEYGLDDGVMCEGYEGDGFDFGDADPKISINYAKNGGHPDYAQPKKAGNRLMYFFTKTPLPQQTTTMSVVKQKLNRAKTGFVSATEFHFDINSDAIPDFVVWEGTGVGPGHLDGPTKTDDAWHRIFFVNIAGQWHLLGTDTYSYGCGC